MEGRVASLVVLLPALLALALATLAAASPDLAPTSCVVNKTDYGTWQVINMHKAVTARKGEFQTGFFSLSSYSGSFSRVWNSSLYHWSWRAVVVHAPWNLSQSFPNAWYILEVARWNLSFSMVFVNPSPSYTASAFAWAGSAANQTFRWGATDASRKEWWVHKSDKEFEAYLNGNFKPFKASGVQLRVDVREIYIRVKVYGGDNGATVNPGFYLVLNTVCYAETSGGGGGQPPGQGVTLKTSVSGCAEIDPAPGTYSYAKGSAVTVRGRPQSGATWQGMYIRPAGGGSWSWLPCEWQSGWCVATVTMDQSYEVEASAGC
ncbi:MAG: hypothetical protein QXT28_11820, partial [Thermofilaceae archaeon]